MNRNLQCPYKTSKKGLSGSKKNKCMVKSSVWVITFFLFMIFKMCAWSKTKVNTCCQRLIASNITSNVAGALLATVQFFSHTLSHTLECRQRPKMFSF